MFSTPAQQSDPFKSIGRKHKQEMQFSNTMAEPPVVSQTFEQFQKLVISLPLSEMLSVGVLCLPVVCFHFFCFAFEDSVFMLAAGSMWD